MLEDYYVKPSTIDRIRGSWLAPQIESYLEWLEAHGYSRLVVYRRLPLAATVSLCRVRREEGLQRHCFLQGLYKAGPNIKQGLYKGVRIAMAGGARSQGKDSSCGTQARNRC